MRFRQRQAALLLGGCALYFATFCDAYWRMFGRWSGSHLVMPTVLTALIPLALHVPSLAAVSILLVVVMAFKVAEHARTSAKADPRPDEPSPRPDDPAPADKSR